MATWCSSARSTSGGRWGQTQITSQAVMATSVAATSDGGFLLGGWASASSGIGGKTVSASQDGSALVGRTVRQRRDPVHLRSHHRHAHRAQDRVRQRHHNALRTHSVAVSTSGTIWLTGTFQGTINVGTGALSTSTASAFLLKLN